MFNVEGLMAVLPPFLTDAPADVVRVASLLRSGKVVALPTETVYGLAAHALDEAAVQKIFAIKGRPMLDPLIVHGFDLNALKALAHFPPLALKLAEAFWPGPLTLVVTKKMVVPRLVTAGRATVALRVPAHPLMRTILAACKLPLAAPSANPFGYISPTRAQHVRDSLGDRAPWIVDGGPCEHGLESTIVDVSDPAAPPRLLRPGPITAEMLEKVLGQPVLLGPATTQPSSSTIPTPVSGSSPGLLAPGMLPRHYSPKTPFALLDPGAAPSPPPLGKRAAWIRLRRPPAGDVPPPNTEAFWLSENGDLAEAARTLYDLLRKLDAGSYAQIWCETAPPEGLGPAINDRLRRAAAKG